MEGHDRSQPADYDGIYSKQAPRPQKSPAKAAQIKVQSRRREYLCRNPSYFESVEHELADPVLYERLVKRFQTANERQREGRAKGYGRMLEADLARGETRLTALAEAAGGEPSYPSLGDKRPWRPSSDIENAWDELASSRANGQELWREYLRERFVQGADTDFDYGTMDDNEEYDEMARRDAQDAWFEDEQPSWGFQEGGTEVQGETGIQDF